MHLVSTSYEQRALSLQPRHWLNGHSAELLRPETDRTLCIKHFKPDWSSEEVRAWAEIHQGFASWIASVQALASVVEIAPLVEVGKDYVIRRFISLPISSADFAARPPGAPPELHALKRLTESALKPLSFSPGNSVLAEVARLTLCQPSNGTFWQPLGSRWIVAEPKFARKEVAAWLAAN